MGGVNGEERGGGEEGTKHGLSHPLNYTPKSAIPALLGGWRGGEKGVGGSQKPAAQLSCYKTNFT